MNAVRAALPLLALTLAACRAGPPPLVPAALCTDRALTIHHDERTRGLTLARVLYALDGEPTYVRFLTPATPTQMPIFLGNLPPGRHKLSFQIVEREGHRRLVLTGSLPFDLSPGVPSVLVVETRGDADALLHGRGLVVHAHGCTPGAPPEADRVPDDLETRVEEIP